MQFVPRGVEQAWATALAFNGRWELVALSLAFHVFLPPLRIISSSYYVAIRVVFEVAVARVVVVLPAVLGRGVPRRSIAVYDPFETSSRRNG